MKLSIDSFTYHRYLGAAYPELETAAEVPLSPEELIDRIAAHGVDAIMLEHFALSGTSPVRQLALRQRLEVHGLEVALAWGHPFGLSSGADHLALDDLITHLDVAERLGARVVRICAGGRSTRPANWNVHRTQLLPLLKMATERAGERGLVLALENHGDLLAHEAIAIVEAVDNDALRLCLDTANNLRMLEDVMPAIEKMVPYAAAVHLKDVAADQGDPHSFTFWPSVPIGSGLIDIPRVLRALALAEYTGQVAIELDYLKPDCGDEDEALAQSVTYLRNELAALNRATTFEPATSPSAPCNG